MGPISKKVIAGLKKAKNKKIVNFQEFKEAKEYSAELDKTIVSEESLSKYDPLHAVYVYAQNKVSVLAEQLSDLKAVVKITNALADADDIYLPQGPPMSPLTKSYFTCWGFFDLCVGLKKESFGTIIIDVLKNTKSDPGLIKIVECMQNSRMGIYQHCGFDEGFVNFKELITGKEIKAIVPSGYTGQKGEIWLARILAEPFPELNYGYSVVFTTPYVLSVMGANKTFPVKREAWEDFFDRNLDTSKKDEKIQAYEKFMKHGKNKHFWNEYIFESYVNHTEDMILLAGFPDIPQSLPHATE